MVTVVVRGLRHKLQRRLQSDDGRDGRRWMVFGVLGYAEVLAIGALMGTPGWTVLLVGSKKPTFLDLRAVTSSWDCAGRGIDVFVANPCDPVPVHRPWLYPRIWTLPRQLGLSQASTIPIGIVLVAVFGLVVLWFAGRLTRGEGMVWAALALSPSVMLGVERGNVDLLIFIIVCVATALVRRRRNVAAALLLAGAVLKLYPVFGGIALVRASRRRAVVAACLLVVPLAVYVLATLGDLRQIADSERHVKGIVIAFGGRDLWEGLATGYGLGPRLPVGEGTATVFATLLWPLLTIGAALWLAARREITGAAGRHLDALWAGAGIYAAAYFFGHNSDYRLMFLLLTVPQLMAWARVPTPGGAWAARALIVMLGTLWLSALSALVFPIDEILNWLLCVYLIAVVVQTAPDWIVPLRGFRGVGKRTSAAAA